MAVNKVIICIQHKYQIGIFTLLLLIFQMILDEKPQQEKKYIKKLHNFDV